MKARRLDEREKQSLEEAIAYATSLEASVAELRDKVAQLEREHAGEVAKLKQGRPNPPRIDMGGDGVSNIY